MRRILGLQTPAMGQWPGHAIEWLPAWGCSYAMLSHGVPGSARIPPFCSFPVTSSPANAVSVLQPLSQKHKHERHAVASVCQATWQHFEQLPTYSSLALVHSQSVHRPSSFFILIMQLCEPLLQHRLQYKRSGSISEKQLLCLLCQVMLIGGRIISAGSFKSPL